MQYQINTPDVVRTFNLRFSPPLRAGGTSGFRHAEVRVASSAMSGPAGANSPFAGYRDNRESMMKTRSSHMSTGVSRISDGQQSPAGRHQALSTGMGALQQSQMGFTPFVDQASFARPQLHETYASNGSAGLQQMTGLSNIMNTQAALMNTQHGANA